MEAPTERDRPPVDRAVDLRTPLAAVLAAAGSGITIADATRPGFPLLFVNAAFESLTGYTSADCVGRSCRFLQGPDTDVDAVARVASALREGRDHTEMLLNVRRDGRPFWNELRLSPIRDAAGAVVQFVGVQRDATAEVQGREALERAGQVIARQDQQLAELRALQAALTPPDPPARPGLELGVAFRPAEDAVAGDFHLVAAVPHDGTLIVVGDVVGHGREAAQRAAFVRTAIGTFARFSDDPVRLLEMTNHALIERIGASEDFVSAIAAVYRPPTRTLEWSIAGHHPPLRTGDGVSLESAVGGLPLGIGIDLHLRRDSAVLQPGAGVVLYTDGLPEARPTGRRREAQLGLDAVAEHVRELGDVAPAELAAGLERLAAGHAPDGLPDDLCVVAVRAR